MAQFKLADELASLSRQNRRERLQGDLPLAESVAAARGALGAGLVPWHDLLIARRVAIATGQREDVVLWLGADSTTTQVCSMLTELLELRVAIHPPHSTVQVHVAGDGAPAVRDAAVLLLHAFGFPVVSAPAVSPRATVLCCGHAGATSKGKGKAWFLEGGKDGPTWSVVCVLGNQPLDPTTPRPAPTTPTPYLLTPTTLPSNPSNPRDPTSVDCVRRIEAATQVYHEEIAAHRHALLVLTGGVSRYLNPKVLTLKC